jgi:hypothetical protein
MYAHCDKKCIEQLFVAGTYTFYSITNEAQNLGKLIIKPSALKYLGTSWPKNYKDID